MNNIKMLSNNYMQIRCWSQSFQTFKRTNYSLAYRICHRIHKKVKKATNSFKYPDIILIAKAGKDNTKVIIIEDISYDYICQNSI